MKVDWQEVVKREPKGYVELNNGERVLHGPIESVKINGNNMVVIILKWFAKVSLGCHGLPEGDWEVAENEPIIFPNSIVPFVIENTPEKGDRVRFKGTNILYFNKVDGLDPSKVRGLEL